MPEEKKKKLKILTDLEKYSQKEDEIIIYAPKICHFAYVNLSGVPLKGKELNRWLKAQVEKAANTTVNEFCHVKRKTTAMIFAVEEKIRQKKVILLPALIYYDYIKRNTAAPAIYVITFDEYALIMGLSPSQIIGYRLVEADQTLDALKEVSKAIKRRTNAEKILGFTNEKSAEGFEYFDLNQYKEFDQSVFIKNKKEIPIKAIIISIFCFISSIIMVYGLYNLAVFSKIFYEYKIVEKQYKEISEFNKKVNQLSKYQGLDSFCLRFIDPINGLPMVVKSFEATRKTCKLNADIYAFTNEMKKNIEQKLAQFGGHYDVEKENDFYVYHWSYSATGEKTPKMVPYNSNKFNNNQFIDHHWLPPASEVRPLLQNSKNSIRKKIISRIKKAASALVDSNFNIFEERCAYAIEATPESLPNKVLTRTKNEINKNIILRSKGKKEQLSNSKSATVVELHNIKNQSKRQRKQKNQSNNSKSNNKEAENKEAKIRQEIEKLKKKYNPYEEDFTKKRIESFLIQEIKNLERLNQELKIQYDTQLKLKQAEVDKLKKKIEDLKKEKEKEQTLVNPDGYQLAAITNNEIVLLKGDQFSYFKKYSLFPYRGRFYELYKVSNLGDYVILKEKDNGLSKIMFVPFKVEWTTPQQKKKSVKKPLAAPKAMKRAKQMNKKRTKTMHRAIPNSKAYDKKRANRLKQIKRK